MSITLSVWVEIRGFSGKVESREEGKRKKRSEKTIKI